MERTEKIDILFFERPLVDLKRYAFKIASALKKIDNNLVLATISLELPPKNEKTDVDFHFYRNEIKDIDSFLRGYSVRIIVFTNPRIPDMEMILHAHKLGIKTIMIQEGVIFEGANINDVSASNMISSLKFIPKTLSYFGILQRMCRYDNRSYFGLLKEIVSKKKNITSIVAHYFSPFLIGDYILTMGDYWADYYRDTMKYPEEKIRVMGDHDLDGFEVHEVKENAICYIATVLVEDGSRSKEEFSVFLDALSHTVNPETKLYLKLHPRSDDSLYDVLKDHNVEIIRRGELPSTTIYIGHRSTLLARALYESDNLIIWKFPNEKEDFFEQFASYTVSSEKELKEALRKTDISTCMNSKRQQMEKIYWLNPKGAINSAAEMIYQYLTVDSIPKILRGDKNENSSSNSY